MKNVPQELSCFFIPRILLPKSNHPTFYSGGSEITNRGRINELECIARGGTIQGTDILYRMDRVPLRSLFIFLTLPTSVISSTEMSDNFFSALVLHKYDLFTLYIDAVVIFIYSLNCFVSIFYISYIRTVENRLPVPFYFLYFLGIFIEI